MIRGLRRVVSSHLVVTIVVLAVGAAVAGAALVGFSAETRNQASVYAGGWLGAPTVGATPTTLAGYGVTFTWTAATHGMATGGATTPSQVLTGSRFSTNPTDCSTATFTDITGSPLSATATTTSDNQGSTFNGYYICYRIESRRSNWVTGTPFPLIQIGLVPAGAAAANVTTAGTIRATDTITLSFNQNITYAGSTPINVCTFTSGTILIGASSCSAATNPTTIGKVTGLTIAANRTFGTSSVGASGKSLVITLGGAGQTTVSGTGTFTYTGASNLVASSAGSPTATLCTTAPRCTWTWSGSF